MANPTISPARNVMPATESARVTDTPTSTLPVDPIPEGAPSARNETEREAAERAGLRRATLIPHVYPVHEDGMPFFAFGALHAPLGGVPAFFITGVGIGFGINRELKPPSMETITANPFLVAMKALGPAPEPKEQLKQMGANIGPKRGEYWVAAGISFTSFVLISGEIVVTVAFGATWHERPHWVDYPCEGRGCRLIYGT